MQQQNSGVILNSLRDILYVVFRHKLAIFLVFVLTAVIVTLVTFSLPQVYESSASVLVRIGRENLPGDPQVTQAMVNVNQDRTSEVKSEIAIITSVELADKVVDEVGEAWILGKRNAVPEGPKQIAELGDFPSDNIIKQIAGTASETAKGLLIALRLREPLTPRQEAVKKIQGGLLAEMQKQTNTIDVTFEHKIPAVAQFVLKRLMTYYYAKHVEVFAAQTHPQFFTDETKKLADKLAESEQTISDFKSQNNISQIDTQIEVLIGQIADLEGSIATTAAETKGLEAMVDNLKATLAARPKMHEVAYTSGMVNYAADTIKEKLIELRSEEKDLSNRFQDSYRPLEEIRENIKALEGQLQAEKEFRTETTTQLDRNYEGMEHTMLNESAQIAARHARHAEQTAELERLKGELALLNGRQVELARLTRDHQIAEKEYKEYREHLQRSTIAAAMDQSQISNVNEVQAASAPLDPVRPKKARNIGLGLLLGLFLGLCYAFLLEFLDDSLNTVEGAEKRLGVPVLAALSVDEYKQCT
jgi:succinoglycan biosynthesis transport protein ExoP